VLHGTHAGWAALWTAGQILWRGAKPGSAHRGRPRNARPLNEAVLRRDGTAGLRPVLGGSHQRVPLPDGRAAAAGRPGRGSGGRHARRAEGLRRAAALPGRDQPALVGIRRAYEQAAGAWTGCDWPTRFGRDGLDLNGWTAEKAQSAADERRDAPAEELWQAAAAWLSRLEHFARRAEEEAVQAVQEASAGAWRAALRHAQRAREFEYATGRSVWRGTPTT